MITIIFCIPDLQIPFEHQDAFDFVCAVVKKYRAIYKGKRVRVIFVNMGDEVDQHTLAKWTADPDGLSGGMEFTESKIKLAKWFKKFPRMLICESNHTYRVFKRAFDVGIPSAFLKSIAEAYGAPKGWKWAQRWTINQMIFEHGEGVSGINAARSAAVANQDTTIIGHQHSNAGVQYVQCANRRIFGFNTGCLIDVDAYAFKYGSKMRNKPCLGMGVIVNGKPYWEPMDLKKNKRWVGFVD